MAVMKRVPSHKEIFYVEDVLTEEGEFDAEATKSLVEETLTRLDEEEHLMKVTYRHDHNWGTIIEGWTPGIMEEF